MKFDTILEDSKPNKKNELLSPKITNEKEPRMKIQTLCFLQSVEIERLNNKYKYLQSKLHHFQKTSQTADILQPSSLFDDRSNIETQEIYEFNQLIQKYKNLLAQIDKLLMQNQKLKNTILVLQSYEKNSEKKIEKHQTQYNEMVKQISTLKFKLFNQEQTIDQLLNKIKLQNQQLEKYENIKQSLEKTNKQLLEKIAGLDHEKNLIVFTYKQLNKIISSYCKIKETLLESLLQTSKLKFQNKEGNLNKYRQNQIENSIKDGLNNLKLILQQKQKEDKTYVKNLKSIQYQQKNQMNKKIISQKQKTIKQLQKKIINLNDIIALHEKKSKFNKQYLKRNQMIQSKNLLPIPDLKQSAMIENQLSKSRNQQKIKSLQIQYLKQQLRNSKSQNERLNEQFLKYKKSQLEQKYGSLTKPENELLKLQKANSKGNQQLQTEYLKKKIKGLEKKYEEKQQQMKLLNDKLSQLKLESMNFEKKQREKQMIIKQENMNLQNNYILRQEELKQKVEELQQRLKKSQKLKAKLQSDITNKKNIDRFDAINFQQKYVELKRNFDNYKLIKQKQINNLQHLISEKNIIVKQKHNHKTQWDLQYEKKITNFNQYKKLIHIKQQQITTLKNKNEELQHKYKELVNYVKLQNLNNKKQIKQQIINDFDQIQQISKPKLEHEKNFKLKSQKKIRSESELKEFQKKFSTKRQQKLFSLNSINSKEPQNRNKNVLKKKQTLEFSNKQYDNKFMLHNSQINQLLNELNNKKNKQIELLHQKQDQYNLHNNKNQIRQLKLDNQNLYELIQRQRQYFTKKIIQRQKIVYSIQKNLSHMNQYIGI